MKNHEATCSCGKAGVTVLAAPSARFRCHCTICQRVYADNFSDVLVFRRGQLKLIDETQVNWTRTKKVTPLTRALCVHCDAPVMAHFYGLLAFMPKRALADELAPDVSMDIYYDTRVKELLDDVPKSSGLIGAYAGLSLPFLKVLFRPSRPLH